MPLHHKLRQQKRRLDLAHQAIWLHVAATEVRGEAAVRRSPLFQKWVAEPTGLGETRRIARLNKRLGVQHLVDRPTQEPLVNGRRTDRVVLECMSHAVLLLDIDRFQSELSYLIESLEFRAKDARFSEYPMLRLDWWCRAVNTASGFLQLANLHFLYRLGRLPCDSSYVSRLEKLAIIGITHLDARFGRRIDTVPEWIDAIDGEDRQARSHLAGAINYLARDSFKHESADPLQSLVQVVHQGHLDMVMTCARLPFPNYSDPQAGLYRAINGAIDQTADFFDPTPGSEYICWLARVVTQPGTERGTAPRDSLARVFGELMQAGAVHARDDVIEMMSERFELGPSEIASLTKKPPNLWDEQLLDDFRSGDAARLDRALNRLFDGDDTSTRLSRVSLLLDGGLVETARAGLPAPRAVLRMTLPELHHHLRLMDVLADRGTIVDQLLAAGQRLRVLARGHLHDVNLVARVIQYSNLVESVTTIENARAAFDICTERGMRARRRNVDPRHVVLLALNDDRVSPALLAPLSEVLASAGVPFYQLQDSRLVGDAIEPWPFSPLLAADSRSIQGIVQAPTDHFRTWEIDLEAGLAKCDGLNLFEGVYEAVARIQKVFDVDWSLPATSLWANLKILQMDRSVHALELVRGAAESRDLRIRLVSLQSHFAPFYALRAFCNANPDRFEHVTLGASYENWKTNVAGEPLSTLTLLNNTRVPAPSMPAFGRHDDFEEFFRERFMRHRSRYAEMAHELTTKNRAGRIPEETANWIAEMQGHRAQGRRVLCLLGKIPYDLGVPYQGGPAHSSMKDWLRHTIDCAKGAEVAIYLKPHPHELNLSISARTIQSFVDLCDRPLPSNVRVLPHRGVNVQDLIPVVDLFLVWNGSSIAELGLQGAAVVAADDWAALNYPINVTLPSDRPDYESIVRGEREVQMHPSFRERSEAYVCYLTEAPFALPFPFVARSSTNTEFNRATVDLTRLDDTNMGPLRERAGDILRDFGICTAEVGETP